MTSQGKSVFDPQTVKTPTFHGVPVYDILQMMDTALNKGRRVEVLLDRDGRAVLQSIERKRLKTE